MAPYLGVSMFKMTDIVLAVNGLCKSFGMLAVNQDITLELRKNEIHALIGSNGAGKSTLIDQISGKQAPDFGNIIFLDQNITKLDTVARARLGLGRTFQVSTLPMHFTVLQNALLGTIGANNKAFDFFKSALDSASFRATALEALNSVDLAGFEHKLTAELSHGQRRQLEIAIALTLKPKALLMDEPMAGLGAEGSSKLTDFLGELKNSVPILLIEHDMDAVFTLADRVSVLDAGKIIATGTVDEIRTNSDVQRVYLGESN